MATYKVRAFCRFARKHRITDHTLARAAAAVRTGNADADALHVLIYKRLDLTHADVSKVLREEGIEISQTTIGRHRRGQCATCRK